MISNKNKVGDRIRQIRAVMSQQDFADKLGVSLSTLRRYESGERPPDAGFLVELYEKHHIQPLWVLTGDGSISIDDPQTAVSAPKGPEMDEELMSHVIHALLTACYKRQIKPNPEAFANAAVGVYQMSISNGSMPPQNALERLVGALDQ
jgi:transcriptional regulator with XRE-family HTH domain